MPAYGLIDLGSNTVRLAVYEVGNDRLPAYTSDDFESAVSDKIMAGLSAYVEDGVFTQAGIDRAADALRGHAKRAQYLGCKRLDVFATAVLRNARNRDEAVAAIEAHTGLPIAVLSERDEAHLGFVGAACGRVVERGTLVDIGGGSTELSRVRRGADSDNASLGQGSLSSFARHVRGVLPAREEMAAIDREFRERLDGLPNPDAYRADTLYGIGGSVRAAAKFHAVAHGQNTRPKSMTKRQIREILDLCTGDPCAFAHLALKASAERVHTLVPGCVILHALLERCGADRLEICKHGVREGYLIERMLS